MSFTNNASNLTGKSTTNVFNVIADSLTVNKNTLCKGDLTVLGNTNIGSVSLENGYVNNLTVNNFTATNPVPISSGGTGLSTLGAPNQVLTVNPAGTALIYQAQGLTNPATITGTGFLGNPTLSLGLEADTGSLGRGFIRTGVAATSGLCLGTSSATVFRLWSNFPSDSNAEISNTNANFTYNSSGTSGVFQVLNGGGSISFTNIGVGTISMATGAGAISLTTGAGATSITTGAGPISLTTGLGNISLTTAGAGIISIETATAGAINIGASVGLVNLYGSGITLGAPVIYIGTGSAVPVPSILTFACGAVNGITGAWAITTAAFQLNALSVTLNSTGTILLNNASTINGDANIIGDVFANASNLASTTVVNPAVFVYSGGGNNWGIDLGYNSSSARFRTRIFAPTGGDIALSIGSGSDQSDFSDKLIVQGNTGNVQVIDGNILTNQNIVGGIEIINSGNLTLTATSAGTILIRGGSGSIITLPDATTLIVGYIYTINNNSNHTVTVNYHNSGTLGSIPPLNAGTVSCIATNSANGQWDLHITGPTTGTDWATPGQIGSAVPNTGVFTTLSATGNIFGNSSNIANTTTLNPAICIYSGGGQNWGMDLGYAPFRTKYRTRVFAPTGGEIALSVNDGFGTAQINYIDSLIVNSSKNIEIPNNLLVNSENGTRTLTVNPQITVYKGGVTIYGMDLGYNSSPSSNRYRTRIFAPTAGDISLSLLAGAGIDQTDYSDRFIIRGDSGIVEIFNPVATSTQITRFLTPNLPAGQTSSIIVGRANSTNESFLLSYTPGASLSDSQAKWGFTSSSVPQMILNANGYGSIETTISSFTNAGFTVTNSSTDPRYTGAILGPNVNTGSTVRFAVGKALSANNSTVLNFESNGTNSMATWSIYNSASKITQMHSGDISVDSATSTYINTFYRFTSAANVGFFTSGTGPQGSLNACGYINSYQQNITTLTSGDLIVFWAANGVNVVGNINTNGSNLTLNSTSDSRLKTNIQPVSNILSLLEKVEPVSFSWKNNLETTEIGFIADDLYKVIPSLTQGTPNKVKENGDPEYMSVSYGHFSPYLVAAIKELYSKIKILETKVASLENNL